MEIINKNIEKYILLNLEKQDILLQEIEDKTIDNIHSPNMISGQYQGRFLSIISKIINPKYILEIGTYTGYSALCLAEGLKKGGKLITIDSNSELIEKFTRENIEKSNYNSQIEIKIGKAIEIIPNLEYEFDIVFIDADKRNYINYFNLVIDKLRKGGVIISDNILWKGKIVENSSNDDKITKSIIEYNNFLKEDKRIDNIILPIRDGISLSFKR